MSFKDSGRIENVVNLMTLSTNQSPELLIQAFSYAYIGAF